MIGVKISNGYEMQTISNLQKGSEGGGGVVDFIEILKKDYTFKLSFFFCV